MHPWCWQRTFWWCDGHSIHQIFQKKKNGKDQNSVSCTIKITYFWFPQGTIIFPAGVREKWDFRREGGAILWADFIKLQRGGGSQIKVPSVGAIVVFWNYKIIGKLLLRHEVTFSHDVLAVFPWAPSRRISTTWGRSISAEDHMSFSNPWGSPGGWGSLFPCSLPKLPYVPMFSCSHTFS